MLVNKDAYQRETLTKWPVWLLLNLFLFQSSLHIGHEDTGAYWRSRYETEDIASDADNIYQEFLPLYQQMHTYVRRKLTKYYGDKIDTKGPLPANVLGMHPGVCISWK